MNNNTNKQSTKALTLYSQLLLTSTPTSESVNQFIPGDWISILTYGGVAVAVILAIAILNQIQFTQIITLVKTLKNKNP